MTAQTPDYIRGYNDGVGTSMDDVTRLLGMRDAVAKLHYKPRGGEYCVECARPFPCKTVRALGADPK